MSKPNKQKQFIPSFGKKVADSLGDIKKTIKIEEPKEEKKDERVEYNCNECGGDGLISQAPHPDKLCPTCGGTGKI